MEIDSGDIINLLPNEAELTRKIGEKQLSKHKKRKRKRKPDYESMYRASILENHDEERDPNELELENLVFGGETDILERLESKDFKSLKKKAKKKKEDTVNFDIEALYTESLESQNTDDGNSSNKLKQTKEAWVDEDDEKILVSDKSSTYRKCHRSVQERGQQKYKDYAREMFIKVNGVPDWAKLEKTKSSDSDDESDEELLKKTGNFVTKSKTLPKGLIDIRKCQNITEQNSSSAIYKSVEFHRSSRVALAASLNGAVTLYQVDGKTNSKIQSVFFEKFPIFTAHFTVDGNEIVVGSRECGHFFSYDMIRGKISKIPWDKGMEQANVKRFQMSPDGKLIAIHGRYGNIHLVGSKSKEWISSLKMNGEVVAVTFNQDGSRMYSHGSTGQVYIWDMSTRQCIQKFTDEGCITGTALAASPNDQYLATGSDSGVVNVYDRSTILSSSDPKPLKVIMNLTTEITDLKFNCTSEILAMASSHKKESVRMVHFPSATVFSNFPNQSKMLNYINSLDISLNSGYLMMGNNTGRVYLYRLRHYANY